MSNYIDAEKLKDEITKRIGKYDSMLHECSIPVVQGKREEAFALLAFIDSLQQERSSEVDLNEEVERFAKECGYKSAATIDFQFAHHFYELGLKARKEESK